MRILCFGDSITQGFWDTDGGWVQRLRKQYDAGVIAWLDSAEGGSIVEFFNLGVSGDTTRNLLRRIKEETSIRANPHEPVIVVVIAIGTNDCLTENNERWVSIEEFRRNLERIVRLLTPLASHIILVGNPACDETKTTPVSWGAYFYTNAELERSEYIIKDIAGAHKLPFVPLFAGFKAKLETGEKLLADGVHPNDAGHAHIASQVLPVLEKLTGLPKTV